MIQKLSLLRVTPHTFTWSYGLHVVARITTHISVVMARDYLATSLTTYFLQQRVLRKNDPPRYPGSESRKVSYTGKVPHGVLVHDLTWIEVHQQGLPS